MIDRRDILYKIEDIINNSPKFRVDDRPEKLYEYFLEIKAELENPIPLDVTARIEDTIKDTKATISTLEDAIRALETVDSNLGSILRKL